MLTPLVSAEIDERLRKLKQMSPADLAVLPAHSSEAATIGGMALTITVWHDQIGASEHRIVVQVYRPGVLVGRMYADGFVINPTGDIRPLTLEEWAPFS